jgi:type III pantothenate kinase
MLIAMDAGNSRLKCAAFRGASVAARAQIGSADCENASDVAALVRSLADRAEGDLGGVRVAVASVVPRLTTIIEPVIAEVTGRPALVVGPSLDLGLTIAVAEPRRIGSDRLADAVAGVELCGAPVAVFDFGTATTMTVVSRDRHLLGGAIAPGFGAAASALASATGLLPLIPERLPACPPPAIGSDTEAAIRSGIWHSIVGMVLALSERVAAVLGEMPRIVATGGFASLIAPQCPRITHVEADLTLLGIRRIADLNAER